jgi:protein gp37
MLTANQHTYMILTKRPRRMRGFFDWNDSSEREFRVETSRKHIWLGVTAEDQQRADERIPLLLQCPAAVRFVSCEPLLESIDIAHYTELGLECSVCTWKGDESQAKQKDFDDEPYGYACPRCLNPCGHVPIDETIDWVIAGGETGPGARPAHPEWFRSLQKQCQAASVPFFFKGHGKWVPQMESVGPLIVSGDGSSAKVVGIDGKDANKQNGPYVMMSNHQIYKSEIGSKELDGREYHEFPKG